MSRPLRVLVSGCSVAGPTLAFWLARQGCAVTVVERMPWSRVRTGGNAVDLFGPAMDVVEWMGALPEVLAARTGTETVCFRNDAGRGPDVDLSALVAGISSRHAEVMRGELAAALCGVAGDAEYVFGDSITSLDERPDGVTATFEHRAPGDFDLVVGADGLHSVVRRLAFGDEEQFLRPLGGHLAVFGLPDHLDLGTRMFVHNAPGRMAAMYPVHGSGRARAGFLFRSDDDLTVTHGDREGQQRLLRRLYGGAGWEVPHLLAAMEEADDFYFDSISQVVMDRWSRGRVALVGDAGYSPGPAVGGGTSLAVVGAYLLADALRRHGPDLDSALRDYDDAMRSSVVAFRAIGPSTMGTLIPRTRAGAWLVPRVLAALTRLPAAAQQRLAALQRTPATALAAVRLPPPPGRVEPLREGPADQPPA